MAIILLIINPVEENIENHARCTINGGAILLLVSDKNPVLTVRIKKNGFIELFESLF